MQLYGCRAGTFQLSSVANQINISAERRAARTTQRAKIGLERRGVPMPSRLLPATVPLGEQFARHGDPVAAVDALNRIARSRGLGGVLGAWRLPPKTDDWDAHRLSGNVFWHGELLQAQCERNRALLAVCCSGPSRFDSGKPT